MSFSETFRDPALLQSRVLRRFAALIEPKNGVELETLAAECAAAGSECVAFQGDVRDAAAVEAAVAATLERFGRIDILFNNAGICAYGLAHELSEDAWDAMLDINLKGAWLVSKSHAFSIAWRYAVKKPTSPLDRT